MTKLHIVLLMLFAVWLVVYMASLFLPFDKYGLDVTPVYMMFRTEKLNNFFSKFAKKSQRFWRTFTNIGVAVAVVEMSLSYIS